MKIIARNKKASFNYFLLDTFEAGIVLKGSEVKSLRIGKGSIADSYAVDIGGEIFLINSHIPLYRQSSYNNHDPKGDRKLLLRRKEINKKHIKHLIKITKKGSFLLNLNYEWLDSFKSDVSDRIVDTLVDFGENFTIELKVPLMGAKIFYTLDNYRPSENATEYTSPLKINVPQGQRKVLKTIVIAPSGRRSVVTETVLNNGAVDVKTK